MHIPYDDLLKLPFYYLKNNYNIIYIVVCQINDRNTLKVFGLRSMNRKLFQIHLEYLLVAYFHQKHSGYNLRYIFLVQEFPLYIK